MTLEELTALEAIKQLKARYFRCMDTKDWRGWGEVFAEDATMFVEHGVERAPEAQSHGPVAGRANIVAYVRTAVDAALTVHHGHMPEIEITSPSEARGVWAMEDIVELPGGRTLHGHGHYHETYVVEGGAWRIKSLHLTRLRVRRT